VLVAVLILALGLVAAARLQLASKRANFEAMQRSTAASLAQDIIERMRYNPTELAAYTNDGAGLTLDGATLSPVSCSPTCTPVQVATRDLYEWEQALAGAQELGEDGEETGGLTAPTACITGPPGGSAVYTVAIAWRGMNRLSNPTASPCGQGSGRYDGAEADDAYRRLLAVQTFIEDPG
jgi:type IV pilus assembly protein PilV